MGNFGKNEQNPHDNLKPKFRPKLLKMNKTHKKSMSSRRIHTLFFAYNRIGVSRILRPLQYVQEVIPRLCFSTHIFTLSKYLRLNL